MGCGDLEWQTHSLTPQHVKTTVRINRKVEMLLEKGAGDPSAQARLKNNTVTDAQR